MAAAVVVVVVAAVLYSFCLEIKSLALYEGGAGNRAYRLSRISM